MKTMIEKGQEIVGNEELSRNPVKELSALVKNIRLKKTSIDELSEVILNTIAEEEMDEEMKQSSDLDVYVDTELDILTEHLEKKLLVAAGKRNAREEETVSSNHDQRSHVSSRSPSPLRERGRSCDAYLPRDSDFDYDGRSVRSKFSRSSSPVRSVASVSDSHGQRERRNKVRLPKLEMKKFGGDPMAWPEFYETFKVSVHENYELSDVERFSYLKTYVFGEAASCIQGLPLTPGNYFQAIKLLEDRFGNQQLIVSKHMNALLDLPAVASASHIKELRSVFDKIVVNIRALNALGITSEQFGPMLSPVVMKMLPNDIKFEVSRRLGSAWKIDQLLDLLSSEIKTRESFSQRDDQRKNPSKKDREQPKYTVESLAVGSREVRCVFCSGGHFSEKCPAISDVTARYAIVSKERLCFKCLGNKHNSRTCKSKGKCHTCGSPRHHSALCQKPSESPKSDPPKDVEPLNPKPKVNVNGDGDDTTKGTMLVSASSSLSVINRNPVFLQTIRVIVTDSSGTLCMKANILFDGGSMKTYITHSFVQRLNLKATKQEFLNIGAFGEKTGKLTSCEVFPFSLVGSDGNEIPMQGSAVPDICAPMDDYRMCVRELKDRFHLEEYIPESQIITGEIDILVGGDFYWSLVSRDTIDLTENLVLKPSKVGFMLSGSERSPVISCVTTSSAENSVSLVSISRNEEALVTSSSDDNAPVVSSEDSPSPSDQSLNESVQRFWDLEAIGIAEREKSVCEITEEKIHQRDDGRYEVELPVKENHPILHDNYFPCVKRLSVLQNRLQKEGLLMNYDEIIQQQIRDGIVEIVPADEPTPAMGDVTYLPHRAVVKDDKVTTKMRIVYDCSAKSGGTSLNDCLYKGPCVTPLIFDCLLRFRANNIALVADIASAYLQISVVPEQRDLLRFLWFKNVINDDYTLQKLRFNRILFGAAPSQFLLNAVIRTHAQTYHDIDPTFTKIVHRGFYVDDLNTSLNSSAEAIEFYEKCNSRFGDAKFEIRKWRTNDPVLSKVIHDDGKTLGNLSNGKVLGIPWYENEDMLVVRLCDSLPHLDSTEKVTKRLILKTVASFYDPPGWIQPAVVKLKILFQEAWKLELDWDSEVPEELATAWQNVITDLRTLNTIRIPRCYCPNEESNPIVSVDLHGFSDASSVAYGACVYLKFTLSNGEVRTSLVASKSRVAPLKNSQTIPRLELMGNVVLARLIEAVCNALKDEIPIRKVHCHTDSKISLSWIKAVSKEFQVFVENRVVETRSKVSPDHWSYVRTDHNPADLLTRADNNGLNEKLWWEGPEFLKTSDTFPSDSCEPGENEVKEFEKEVRLPKQSTLLVAAEKISSIDNVIDINKYGDMLRLLRVTAYVQRFVRK